MNGWMIMAVVCVCWVGCTAEIVDRQLEESFGGHSDLQGGRDKRTLFLKKKILGAGLLGLGLGVAKGYKLGRHHAPEVHHVYLAPPPPPAHYVEYIEKPVYIEKIVEKPVFKPSHVEYDHQPWSPPEPSPVYGSW